ncbi:hypothetical protein DBR06_SOUSAS8010043, partial [Sousa chinensis]
AGTPSCKTCLVSQVGPREELMTAERGILCAMGVDWESQLKPKESTPLQDILEENSSHDLQMVRFTGDDSLLPLIEEVEEYGLGLDLRMQIKPMMGERGTPLTPGDRSALQESPWSSEDTVSLGSAVPAQDPTWLREESTEEEAVAPGTLNTCLQVSN